MNGLYSFPDIPAYITVHIGEPDDIGENVYVSFPDYIKSVSSMLVDPNMPEEALYAVMYAQVTLALNRIINGVYRKRGYSFDITSDPTYDQAYEYNYPVYDNVNRIADSIFNEYVSRDADSYPIDADICYEGLRCSGLSVEGSIEMAENGQGYEDILKYYFGRDIYIAKKSEVSGLKNDLALLYPIYPGESGNKVTSLNVALNRIGSNYSTIPKVDFSDDIYGSTTTQAVKEFQRIFDLEQTGIVEKTTYYKLLYVYTSISRLADLVKAGKELSDILPELRSELKYGSVGNTVKLLQYYLSLVSAYESRVPPLQIIGVFGENTYQSVTAFQKIFGLSPDGVVTEEVWEILRSVYTGLYSALPPTSFGGDAYDYFGSILILGSEGADVRYLQEYLKSIGNTYGFLSDVDVSGIFDEKTENAVKEFQKIIGIKDSGVVTSTTWNAITGVYNAIIAGNIS